ncbi:helix-turn-helix transcriptional regulator [Sphingopyxis solisilvae]|uniref:helix-turn-helix transcriptional regulator n=1 Tax=Sphingopyxis solisilvae TaxID=1886788 RepID=UPI001892A2D8|nr:LuxR C-terminal-related transcriptional regulator [Sphingopyxis solisilvae]
MTSHSSGRGEFAFLTAKQAAVLDHLANNRTSKEIAHTLGVSETAINRRIEVLRNRLGGVTRHELARRYRLWAAARERTSPHKTGGSPENISDFNAAPCVETEFEILQLAESLPPDATAGRDGDDRLMAFEDPVAMSIEAPWSETSDPRIVPGVLDGDNATLTRGAAIAILVFAILASVVVAIATAKALAEAVS